MTAHKMKWGIEGNVPLGTGWQEEHAKRLAAASLKRWGGCKKWGRKGIKVPPPVTLKRRQRRPSLQCDIVI